MLTAIIVAGGSSRRMGFDKTFALLGDKPVVAHSIAAFEAATCVDEIIVVGRAERVAELQDVISRQGFGKVARVVPGGTHRQDSVSAGLAALDPDCRYVAVHDAARPLIQPMQIERAFHAAQASGAAAVAAPVTDTLKRADEQGVVCGAIDRTGLYAMQTPQIFARDLLLEAFAFVQANQLVITDEVSALEHLGHAVVLVPNEDSNFKITFPADLTLAEFVLQERARTAGR
jgi:2-C-methyl-D-erythritol 4-phosphate cytidylyltransferase